jgi:NTE family protein
MSIDGKTIGLALSGGGYRASLFGLGTLWRLNDAGLLGRLDRITSVSGGSILAGVLAHHWTRLRFSGGRADNFVEEVAAPIEAFCATTIDIGAGLAGLLTPFKSAGDFLVDTYERALFGDTTLKDLPAAGDGVPQFTFYATSLQTGRSVRLRQDKIADYLIGESSRVVVSLATAVAASSAFPPVFSPIILETDPADWTGDERVLPNAEALRRRVVLADGGIYDNMGLEALTGRQPSDIVLASDAGAPFEFDEDPAEDYVRQLGRVRDILIDQTRALRKRALVESFVAGRRAGAYWGVTTDIDEYGAAGALARSNALTQSLDQVPTRLTAFDEERQGHLINWGYALCDAALRTRTALPVPAAPGLPKPAWPLG